jgi:hypothetical protein
MGEESQTVMRSSYSGGIESASLTIWEACSIPSSIVFWLQIIAESAKMVGQYPHGGNDVASRLKYSQVAKSAFGFSTCCYSKSRNRCQSQHSDGALYSQDRNQCPSLPNFVGPKLALGAVHCFPRPLRP